MLSELSSRSRPLALVVMGALLALPMRGRAQELEAVRPSAFDLLARSPELGGSDIPRDLPGRVTVGPAMRPTVEPLDAETSSQEERKPESDFPLRVVTDGDLESGSTAAPAAREGALTLMPASSSSEPREFQVLPAVVAVVPGLLFHGLAPAVAGDGHTAKRLFALEGAGLGLIAAGGVPIVLTGASRKTIAPLYAVTLAGFSVFGISALANLYSVVSPTFDPGVPPPSLPPLELEMGYQYVSDTSFDYDHFVSLGAVARFDEVKLRATARLAPDEGNTQVRVGGAYRLLGVPERRLEGSDGSSLDAELVGLFHRFPTEGFAVIGADLGLRGRYAMSRVSPALAGSFAEVSLGMSLQGYSYFGPVDDGNLHTQLLFTFGYGVWLGRGGGPFRGEAMLYYDHRKDDFAGGVRSLGGGVVGNFGLRGRVLLTDSWGVAAEAQAGGALVGRLSLIYAFGGDL
ncbi:hypothetical protein LXT21_30600 [Myxococcus sp. K38C18041901]|uniref:hypothetical protein n=1 Tax=Myxococcus guangdongensis TaxID=2906760 RepID=UPI0020A7AF06|nr:hypothetical protein [Myxococcus guangdongensis]MCP3063134.1 hypothetical protein [Myxococcus guangdongensis]